MQETFMYVFIIIVALGLMFTIPLIIVSNNQDDITQTAVQSLVAEFVNKEATKGKITLDDYNEFTEKLYATGNTYSVELEHKIMTTNPNKGAEDKNGENLYYSVYNSTIIAGDNGINNNSTGEYLMKKGDYLICTVKNTNKTLGAQVSGAIYSIGEDTYTIAASESALVVNTGNYSN